MGVMKQRIPGILLCLGIALPASALGKFFPFIGGPVLGILMGMIIIMLFPGLLGEAFPVRLDWGVGYTSKKLLQLSIILLGFEMNLHRVLEVGAQSLSVILFTLSAAFIAAFAVGKALQIKGKQAILIGVGTSICGGSAIAATAPVIQAEDEDVAHAISTIFLFNIAAVFIFPTVGHWLGLSDAGFGMWAGTAINDTSSVVAAGASWSETAGNDSALAFATIVKLTRTLMIVPITLALAVYMTHKERQSQGGQSFRVARVFPWFVLGFVAAALLNTYAGVPAPLSHGLTGVGKFMIVMAMGAIGLNTHLKRLVGNGVRPILLGLSCWIAVAGVSLIVQKILGIW